MFSPRHPLLFRRRRLFSAIFCVAMLFVLSGCSTIDEIHRAHNALASVQEADRQFSIESTPIDKLPNDSQAELWIDRSLALMPHSAVPYVGNDEYPEGITSVLIKYGRYPLLIDLLKKAVADPKLANDPDLLLALAEAQERMGPQPDAEKTYARTLAAINSKLTTAGSEMGTGDQILLTRAEAEYYGGKRTKALKDYASIISTDPDDAAQAQNDLAYMLSLDKSDLTYAKTLATAAVASARKGDDDETLGVYLDTLAWVDHQAGDDSDAIAYEREAASYTPLQADVQYHLGVISNDVGQKPEAKLAFQRAVKFCPYFPEARSALQSVSHVS
jgi:tetratricopeptide (TPR) repeat protein